MRESNDSSSDDSDGPPAYDLEDLGSSGGGNNRQRAVETFQRMVREAARRGTRYGKGASWTIRFQDEDLATTTILRLGDASGRPDVVRVVIHQWADLLPEPRIDVTPDGTIFVLLRGGHEERDEAELARRNREGGEPLDVTFF